MVVLTTLLMSCQFEHDMKEELMLTESNNEVVEVEQPLLSCKLNIAKAQRITDGVFVDFIILNQSESDLYVLQWYTPLEGFYSKIFNITDQFGQPLPYQGPMVKRAKPESSDYQLIRAKGNIATMLDLSSAYNLNPGRYKLELKKPTLQIIENGIPLTIDQCQTDSINFTVN